ncbi:MAG: efflux RND transporter periplasmic adaptor subunit [Thermodesulfobacteriota bacterium]
MKIILAVLLAAFLLPGCEKKPEAPPLRPVNVSAVKSRLMDAPVTVTGVGHVVALQTVAVQPQVTGRLASVHFEEGTLVREGQLLALIDPAPFQAALEQARGNLNRDWAKAAQAGRDYLRYKDLVRQAVVSQDEYEQRRTEYESGWQQVKADQAALEAARINLDYCRIVSPVTGVAGYQLVKPGNTVNAYSTTLVTVNRIQPALVRFSVTEKDLALVRRYYGTETIRTSARFPKDEQDLKETGELTAIDNTLDVQTGMISLQASFANESLTLWPGQFVTVTATVAMEKDRVVIPFDAVMTRQDGSYVFVVTDNSTAELRKIETGRGVGRKDVVVLKGLAPGEAVITEGLVRVAPGGPVKVLQGDGEAGAGK